MALMHFRHARARLRHATRAAAVFAARDMRDLPAACPLLSVARERAVGFFSISPLRSRRVPLWFAGRSFRSPRIVIVTTRAGAQRSNVRA